MADRYFFQNPDDGFPMVLFERHGDGEPTVEPCDVDTCDPQPSANTLKTAERMTRACRGLSLRAAAKLLKTEFGAADIDW